MPIRVERNFDNRMAYLITHIRGRLTLGGMPRSEEVPEAVRDRILTGQERGKPGYKARTIQRATAPVAYPARGHRGSPRPEIAANRPCPRWFLRILSAGACRGAHAECWSKRRRGQIRQHWRGPSW